MEFSKKQPTDADRFLQRVTDTHTSSSIFSQANFNTEDMTPAELAALKAKIKEEQKTALIRAIRHQLQNEFAEDRQEAKKIVDLIDDLLINVYKHQRNIQTHMSGEAIDALIEKIEKRLTFFELKEDVQSAIDSIGI
ncbi:MULTISPECIES: hypothetical protein [Bacillus]|jgi:hypothetical protein|uniref:Uncharacterized protein n=4 Tax=Bacillus TaxID=1386 RepID=A0A653Y1C7_BACAB|nr:MULTISPECIES: hypothetical protein [Bacillus]AHL73401.1 hypothetical protein BW16_19140 [Bacillus pumilus]KML20141.1 hypothetical protein VL09_01585 [Bacillus stratosphericus]KQL43012.1 hypothetical protein AN962_10265 [Bacillus sp. FJAT-21955]MBX7000623.1 hypothetical protein [Bacillus aerophilus]ALM27359.1 hypothetical protein AKO65_04830 [Bacillus altitudinis]